MEDKKQTENEMDDDDIIEEFASGFCKAQNQARMVMCELKVLPDGKKEIVSSDCAWGRCEHTKTCLLMGQIVGEL